MRDLWKKAMSVFLAAALVITLAVPSVTALAAAAAPDSVTGCTQENLYGSNRDLVYLKLEFQDSNWIGAITGVSAGEESYSQQTSEFMMSIKSDPAWYAADKQLQIVWNVKNHSELTVSANGYEDTILLLSNTEDGYSVSVKKDSTGSGSDGSSGEGEEQTYQIQVAEAENGKVCVEETSGIKAGSTVLVTTEPASGYVTKAVTVTGDADSAAVSVTKAQDNSYTFSMPKDNVTVTAAFEAYQPGKVSLSGVRLEAASYGNGWNLIFEQPQDYVAAVTGVKVNDTPWNEVSYTPSSGGSYKKNSSDNTLSFAQKDYSGNGTVLKSGDVVTITADGYEDFSFKLVIDKTGKATLTENDGQGDPYELHVKIDGTFEAAIVGQKDYDGVSSASVGGSSSNKNSAVKVYGALVEKDKVPEEKDWEELDNQSQIHLEGSKCSVSIVPDTEHGTSKDSKSGMKGVYMTISSDLTLNGTPKDAGQYLISVTITDDQGRTATSNTLPFRIYSGEESLADQIDVKNLKQYTNGLYAWDIMEPWAIKNFGSNVEGEKESVRVPKDLEVWFGSHESGTYGFLGYDLPWKQVEKDEIPQTLYIPDGCRLTVTNMKILSSVRIVVEKGGKLTLSDSAVQGIIEVKDGGTFSMNYDSHKGEFTTGASICGQLRLEDGATIENAAIYSHTNYLANGSLKDRSNSEPVVVATGNVTVKGQVFIKGDSAGTEIGQTALRVKDGTLTLADGAVLAAYGGDGKTLLYPEGGIAVELDNGTITGNGKLAAIGGPVVFGPGGTAVSGNGTISTAEAFLQGATSYTSQNAAPGKAVNGNVKITSKYRHIEDGTQVEATKDDPLADLYWKSGIDKAPSLEKFVTTEYVHEHKADEKVWKSDSEKHWNPCGDDSCEEHLNEEAHTFVWVTDRQATTEETGLKHEECTICGYKRNENTAIDKLSGSSGNSNTGNTENSGSAADTGTSGAGSTASDSDTGAQGHSQSFWQKVNSKILSSSTAGEKIRVSVKANSVVPAYVLESLKGKDAYLIMSMPNGVSWSIYGKNITADTLKDIDLGVVLNSGAVPAALKSNISSGKDSLEISLDYDGEFGFRTTLTIPAGTQHAGMYAKVYYYNEAKGRMDYIASGKVDANGNVNVTLTHASDYVLVFDTIGIVQTGDQTSYTLFLWTFLAGLAGLAGLAYITARKKERTK